MAPTRCTWRESSRSSVRSRRRAILEQNVPNPFRTVTHIVYSIPRAEQVSLGLYDVQGRQVQSLVSGRQPAGRYRVDLGARGRASGVYFYRLTVGGSVRQRKLLLMR